jgi:hypothetical protein
MTYADVLKFFGTQTAIAAALGITQPTVWSWRGVVPKQYQYQLEVITAGALRADPALRQPLAGRVIFDH